MRKIKVLALLLAALMVMAAFAGCASKSSVADLDTRVSNLEGKIDEQNTKLDEVNKTVEDSAKKNESANAELQATIKKAVEDMNAAVQAKLDEVEKAQKQEEAASADKTALLKIIGEYGAKVNVLQADYLAKKVGYTDEEYATIVGILGDAETAISVAVDEAAVKSIYADMEKKLAEHPSEAEKVYALIKDLDGNICADSADTVKAAVEAMAKAKVFYGANTTEYTEYKVDAENTINLEEKVNFYNKLQTVDLVTVTNQAEILNKKIADLPATASIDDVTALICEYKAWEKQAENLSPKNVKLVADADTLDKALTATLNITAATAALNAEYVSSKIDGSFVPLFKDYEDRPINYISGNSKTVEIYAQIDAKIAAWIKEYSLNDVVAEYIIDEINGENFYALYKLDRALAQKVGDACDKLVAADGIFAAMKALNGKTLNAGAVDVFKAYEANAEALLAWGDAIKAEYKAEFDADTTALKSSRLLPTQFAAVLDQSVNEAAAKAKMKDGYSDGLNATGANLDFYKLYDFKDTDLAIFLTTTFAQAKAAAEVVNKKIALIEPLVNNNIVGILTNVEGYVKLNAEGDKLVALDATKYPKETVAAYGAQYKTGNYDLTFLVDTATLAKKLETIAGRIAKMDAAVKLIIDDAAKALVDGKNTVVTTDNAAKFTAVQSKINALTTLAYNDSVRAAIVDAKSKAAVTEYTVENIAEKYGFDADFKKLIAAKVVMANEINHMATATSSLLALLPSVKTFVASNWLSNTTLANYSQVYQKDSAYTARKNFNLNAVTATATTEVKNDKNQVTGYKTTATYITYDKKNFKFITKDFSVTNNSGATPYTGVTVNSSANATWAAVIKFNTDSPKLYGYDATATNCGRATALALGSMVAASNFDMTKLDALDGKAFNYVALLDLAQDLYYTFMVNNCGVAYKAVDDAWAKVDPNVSDSCMLMFLKCGLFEVGEIEKIVFGKEVGLGVRNTAPDNFKDNSYKTPSELYVALCNAVYNPNKAGNDWDPKEIVFGGHTGFSAKFAENNEAAIEEGILDPSVKSVAGLTFYRICEDGAHDFVDGRCVVCLAKEPN